MFYIVGLGNPGEKYTYTRHNVGWLLLDQFIAAEGFPNLVTSAKYSGKISEGMVAGVETTILYPTTFMNQSGSAVAKLVPKEAVSQVIVIHDEVDLGIGEVKISVGRGSGGHNGVKSIAQTLGSNEFVRVRVGVASRSFWTGEAHRPAATALSRHVLGNFTRKELRQLEIVAVTVQDMITTIISEGVSVAMNRFN